jgi:hypothetical protein
MARWQWLQGIVSELEADILKLERLLVLAHDGVLAGSEFA